MKSTILHHWRAEYYDRDGDDLLVIERETLTNILENIPKSFPRCAGVNVCLVRSRSNSIEGVLDQWLAYIGGGVLSDHFAEGIIAVPQFAHGMVEAVRDRLAAAQKGAESAC